MASSERSADVASEPCTILGRTCTPDDCDRPCDGIELDGARSCNAMFDAGWRPKKVDDVLSWVRDSAVTPMRVEERIAHLASGRRLARG